MLPPGPTSPRAVQTLAWLTRPGPWMLRLRARYGDAISVRIAHEGTWVLLSDPAAVKEVFTGDRADLHAGEANVVLRPLLGPRSVLLLDEAPHMAQRKLLLPAFHGERLQAYGELIAEIAAREVDGWPAGEPIAMRPRMQALLPIVLRKLTVPLSVGGWELPAGVSVSPCIYLLHRREDVYPEPFAFRPERFLDSSPGAYTWIPFGGGVRRCLGASFAQFEMATVLRVIAERVERLDAPDPAGEPVTRRAITLVPARGARVSAAPRAGTGRRAPPVPSGH